MEKSISARYLIVTAIWSVRFLNLVVPLASNNGHRHAQYRYRRASGLIWRSFPGDRLSLRSGDVDSTIKRSTQPTTRGIRTSMMATRTPTTRTMSSARSRSADSTAGCAPFYFEDLVQAYFDCRRTKRNSKSALAFEIHLERNLVDLYEELVSGEYTPGRSICFVITRPKPREVWAADFRDRIVHHLLYNQISPAFYRRFIADSCACIPGRGTLYAAQRLEAKVRSATRNWSRPCYYLKGDLANFFVSIDKGVVHQQLARVVTDSWWLALADLILFHDPRTNYELRGRPELLELVPAHKRLTSQPDNRGLPIGNLSSQFFANVYLNDLDQFVKHRLGARHYIRYVDDFVILHPSAQWLNEALEWITTFLPTRLGAQLNPSKTIIQPVERGIDFVGQIIKPWRRITRRRSVHQATERIGNVPNADLMPVVNSYFGLMRQATHSHADRVQVAKAVLRRGKAVNSELTQTYRGPAK